MRGMVCDLEAFEPLHSLVVGPLVDLDELTAIERFVRTVVLHDEISLYLPHAPTIQSLNAKAAFSMLHLSQ
jgi:hypothetical protein